MANQPFIVVPIIILIVVTLYLRLNHRLDPYLFILPDDDRDKDQDNDAKSPPRLYRTSFYSCELVSIRGSVRMIQSVSKSVFRRRSITHSPPVRTLFSKKRQYHAKENAWHQTDRAIEKMSFFVSDDSIDSKAFSRYSLFYGLTPWSSFEC